jgi:hypothetical protein
MEDNDYLFHHFVTGADIAQCWHSLRIAVLFNKTIGVIGE